MAVEHRIRIDGKGNTEKKSLTARKAIRWFCRECMGYETHMVRKCTATRCPLYPFRTHDRPENAISDMEN